MTVLKIIILLCIPTFLLNAHINENIVKNFTKKIQRDSVIRYLEEITGSREIYIDGKAQRITSRYRLDPSNELAAKYFENKLSQFGYKTSKNKMTVQQEKLVIVENVSALKKGSANSDKLIVICAHYDSANPLPAQAADDNGSGTAAILEIARVLQDVTTKYDILIAFLDDEERGLTGSYTLVDSLSKAGMKDVLCINFDMIGYSKTKNYNTQVRYDPDIKESKELSKLSLAVDDLLQLKTNILAIHPDGLNKYGLGDACAFGKKGYGNITIIERSDSLESNPCYHQVCDSIGIMDLDYYFENILLGAGVLAEIANHELKSSSIEQVDNSSISQCMPNPATSTLSFHINPKYKNISISLYNNLGLKISDFNSLTQRHVSIDVSNLNLDAGLYFCRFTLDNGATLVRKVCILK